MNAEDFHSDDDMVITLSLQDQAYTTVAFRAQGRGGVGAKGSDTRDDDFVEYIYPPLCTPLFYSSLEMGRCYWLRY